MARRFSDLLSIGDTTVDVFLKIDDATVTCSLHRRACLLCLRYADKIPVASVHRVPAAGNAANCAVGSARLGLAVSLVTTVGADEAGHDILRELRRNRVPTSYVTRDRRHGTNYSTVLNYQGERTILVYHEPRTYRLPPLPRTRWLYLTSMGKGWERIVPSLLRYLRNTGAQFVFNPGTHQLRAARALLARVLQKTHLLLVNREEAEFLLRSEPGTSVRALLSGLQRTGPSTVVITDGPKGAHALAGTQRWFMPPFPVAAVERTGAGDAFSTGFLGAMAYGRTIADALRWGTTNAGSVIQHIGPQAGLLRLPELRRWLRRTPSLVPRALT